MIARFLIITSLVLCMSCGEKNSNDTTKIIDESILAHGGWDTFQKLKLVQLNKSTKLFKEDGSIELETFQKQTFQLQPKYLLIIEWMQDSIRHQIRYDRKKAFKTVGGKPITDSLETEKALNAAKAAEYVFFQPFKLKEDEAIATYIGERTVNGSKAKEMRIRYPGDSDSGDQWWYYFDEENRLIGQLVKHLDHHSFIENLEYQTAEGLVFNKYRKSYRADRELKKQYVRAEYFYDVTQVLMKRE